MIGLIKIEEFKIHCIIGFHPHERIKEQEISLDIEIKFDISKAVQSDHLKHTIDYEKVGEACRELGMEKKYHLIETFAADCLVLLFERFPLLFAKIRVTKRGAVPLAKSVMVEIERSR